MTKPLVDPVMFATVGREYQQSDEDGTIHVIVKSAETVRTTWNSYVRNAIGFWQVSSSSHRTLRDAREHVKKVGGWA